MKKSILFCFLFFCFIWVTAQVENTTDKSTDDLWEISLEDLMNTEVSVSSKSSMNIRETPGIVSVITQEDIQNSGARDMVDLIQRYVPGFDFGVDVEGLIGLSVRGVWSFEGKVLLLIDGVEVNDNMFGQAIFGNHYPLSNVERIEIIRGPGSVVYGGYASMGVINIITKNAEENGGYASYLGSHTGESFNHNNLSFGSQVVKNDLKISFFGDYANGSRSDRNIEDPWGNKRTMTDNSDIETQRAGIKMNYKKLNMSAAVMDYSYETIDLWDKLHQETAVKQNCKDFLSQVSYEFDVVDNVTITPRVSYIWHKPLNMYTPQYSYINSKNSEKVVTSLLGNYKKGIFDVLAGFDYNYETLKLPEYIESGLEEEFLDGSNLLDYHSFNAYGQLGLNTKFANVTAGVRFDKSDLFGDAFSPRFCVTKAFEKFHLKASVNKAFRVPGGILPNRINPGEELKPEESITYEFEAGVKLLSKMYLTFNVFNTDFKKIMIYESTGTLGLYRNSGKLGTYGFESSLKYNSKKLSADLNFAYYHRKDSDTDANVMVDENSAYFLSFSPIKVNAVVSYKIKNHFRVTPSLSFFGARYAYTSIDAANNLILEKINPQALFNVNLTYSNLLVEGFDVSIGGSNLFGEDFKYHNGTKFPHAAVPALDRSIQLKLLYKY